MKLIRFADPAGAISWGVPVDAGCTQADLLDASPFSGGKPTGRTVAVTRLLAPVDPPNLLCIGLNYRRHAEESGMALPERPLLFMKATSTLCAHGDAIVLPSMSEENDYECELAVVIGKAAKEVSEDDALDTVFGYTVANDVSSRDWQLRHDKQWIRGKSFDTFAPMGPILVTADEIPDPQTLGIRTRVNGETLQSSNTADMIFSVKEIISYLSRSMTLLPGTVILTGTPEGVGMGRTPKRWLVPGDICEIEIDLVGTLRNPVVAQ